jgi:hypothetical protein
MVSPALRPIPDRDRTRAASGGHDFVPTARQGFEQSGRGAIVTDLTVTPVKHAEGEGHPFAYLPLPELEKENAKQQWQDAIRDILRMVKAYDPTWEFVCVLLKERRESVYRIGVPEMKK